jgi:predicted small lipoprotein YifL
MIRKTVLAMLAGSALLSVAACEKQGPVEKVGEEVDEAVSTIKNGGEETVGTKVDDAVDHVREDAKDIGEAVKKD